MASSTNLFGLEQLEADSSVDPILIFEEINKELEEYLLEKSIDIDSTDGVFDFLETLSNQVPKNFDELIGEDIDKKRFIRALTHIFMPLLNTTVGTAEIIERTLKIAVETTLKVWQGQKYLSNQQLPKWLLRRGRLQQIERTYSYKIKLTLPEQK